MKLSTDSYSNAASLALRRMVAPDAMDIEAARRRQLYKILS